MNIDTLSNELKTLWYAKSYLPETEAQDKFQAAIDGVDLALSSSQARVKELEQELHEKTQSVAGLLRLAGVLRDKIDEIKRLHPGPFDA